MRQRPTAARPAVAAIALAAAVVAAALLLGACSGDGQRGRSETRTATSPSAERLLEEVDPADPGAARTTATPAAEPEPGAPPEPLGVPPGAATTLADDAAGEVVPDATTPTVTVPRPAPPRDGREQPARTVRRALARERRAGNLTARSAARYRRIYRRARETHARLAAARAAELGAILEQVRALARSGRLTSSRMGPSFALLEQNTAFWSRAPYPSAGQSITFRGDPLTYRYYPGHGLQIQFLASFGHASAAANACLTKLRGQTCRPNGLRRLLDRLLIVSTPRRGALVWESWFGFGAAAPGWISGMTQGVAVQAYARGAAALDERRYLLAARRALGAFEQPPPVGVALRVPGGRRYVMYSTAPGDWILNGHLQAITGLRDAGRLDVGRRAWRAFHRGDRVARRSLGRFDTGAWARYSAGGAEATLTYMELMAAQMDGLCARTRTRSYCGAGARFRRYLAEPPGIAVRTPRRARPGRRVEILLALSKISDVTISVRGPAARTWTARLARGVHRRSFTPPASGRYRVTVVAVGLSGPRAQRTRTIVVQRPPAPKRHRKRSHRTVPAADER